MVSVKMKAFPILTKLLHVFDCFSQAWKYSAFVAPSHLNPEELNVHLFFWFQSVIIMSKYELKILIYWVWRFEL